MCKAQSWIGSAPTALPQRRETQGIDDLARLCGRLDMRHHDTAGTVVESSRGTSKIIGAYPHDRRYARQHRGDGHLRDLADREGGQFRIDEQPIMPGGSRHDAGRGRPQVMDAKSERRLAPSCLNQDLISLEARWRPVNADEPEVSCSRGFVWLQAMQRPFGHGEVARKKTIPSWSTAA